MGTNDRKYWARKISRVRKRFNPGGDKDHALQCQMPCIIRAKGFGGCRFDYNFINKHCHLGIKDIENTLKLRSIKSLEGRYYNKEKYMNDFQAQIDRHDAKKKRKK